MVGKRATQNCPFTYAVIFLLPRFPVAQFSAAHFSGCRVFRGLFRFRYFRHFMLPFFLPSQFSSPNFLVAQFSVAHFPVAVFSVALFPLPLFHTLILCCPVFLPSHFSLPIFPIAQFPVAVSSVAVFTFYRHRTCLCEPN